LTGGQKMAPHGKQMTPEEKQIIVALSQQGYSSYTIAEMTGKNRRTISKFLSRLTGEIVVFLQTGCSFYPSKFKRLRTVLEEILVTNWRLNWSVISPKLCLFD
jgi:IS30 family transposase